MRLFTVIARAPSVRSSSDPGSTRNGVPTVVGVGDGAGPLAGEVLVQRPPSATLRIWMPGKWRGSGGGARALPQ